MMPDDVLHHRNHLPTFPFPDTITTLTHDDLRSTAYEIFVASCRASSSRPLTFISSSGTGSSSAVSAAPSLQRSTTSEVVRKALGMKAKVKRRESIKGGSGETGSEVAAAAAAAAGLTKRGGIGVGDVVRVQMRVSELTDSRVRRALLRIVAGQLGRRIESIVLPLELLQQFQSSDFPKSQDYDAWRRRHIKVLEAGLLLHPHLPLNKTDNAAQRLQQVIRTALEDPREIRRNNEASNALRSTVMSLACRSFDGSTSEMCHWADGFPLNVRLYQVLLEACFDIDEETSMIEEVDEVLDQIKKTWTVLGMNQALHNLCFAWVLFHQYVTTEQEENDLLFAASNLVVEVEKDSMTTKDQEYLKFLVSTLKLILGWTEKRLLAYHDTFHCGNIEVMQNLVSLSVSSAKILADHVSHEHGRKKTDVDVDRQTVETYIRTSSCALYSQKKEKIRRSSEGQQNALPYLSVLAQDIRELVITEKEIFCPVFKRWHPLPAGVAVATLHNCFGTELNNFVTGIDELTPDAMQVLIAADKLEKDLVQIAVEDSVDSEDGGKSIIQEMSPYEVETVISNLVIAWIKIRVDRLKEWVDRNLQQESWSPHANKERFAPSAVEVLRIVDETLEAFFLLPIPKYQILLPRLISGLDKGLQQYVVIVKAGCGNRGTFIPPMPPLTRCTTGSKYNRVPKKKEKEKEKATQRRKSQVGTPNADNIQGVLQLCVRINTLQHFRTQLEALAKKSFVYLKSSDPSYAEEVVSGRGIKFELSSAACADGIRQLCEATAYKVVFQDLSPVLWDSLYVGDVSSSRIEPFLQELESYLETISTAVHDRVRTRVITNVMKASFDGFLLILLAGGPHRAFALEDCQIIEEDFKFLEELFWSNGDGLPAELINKYSSSLKSILPLFRANTNTLIEQFKQTALQTCGPSAKSKLPLPPTPAEWSPNEPNTMLRVICLRNDQSATKFLKKAYNLPKTL